MLPAADMCASCLPASRQPWDAPELKSAKLFNNILRAGVPAPAVAVQDFDWAREDYSPTWRQAAIWKFIASCRLRLFLDNQRWTYSGGMTPEK